MNEQTEYKYDVFISYSHADQDWVRGELLPRLEEAGLKVIVDYRDFEPGAPLVTEMERAVLESQKTVLVLTPSYLESEWATFENVLSQTLDPGAHRRRVLPVVRQPCELPLRIRALVRIDLSVDDESSWNRLINALSETQPATSAVTPPLQSPPQEKRRIDAAAPSHTEFGQRIDLLVQVRFPDSPLLGIEDWPAKQRPPSIEQVSETVALEFPIDRRTGRLGCARLKFHIVAPDFEIAGSAKQIVEVPPDKYSKCITFLLMAKSAGSCRINVEVYSVDHIYLGTIPVEVVTTAGGTETTPTPIVANLFLVVMVAPGGLIPGNSTHQHLRNLLRQKTRRLRILEEQAARYGIATPPHVITEIEDLQAEITDLEAQLAAPSASTPAPSFSSDPETGSRTLSRWFSPLILAIAVGSTLVIVLVLCLLVGGLGSLVALRPTPTAAPASLRPTAAPTFTSIPAFSPKPIATSSPTHTIIPATPTVTSTSTPTPTPTPYYVEIVVDASDRMGAQFEDGFTKMESAWQTAKSIGRIRAQRGEFVTVRLFGGQDNPNGDSCISSHPLFEFTNDSHHLVDSMVEIPTPGGKGAVVTGLLDASDELWTHENIGREIVLLTGGEDECGSFLSVFYNSDNQSLWTQTFVVLFANQNFGPFIDLEAQGANINYDLVRNRAEAETVAEEIAQSLPPTPSPTASPPLAPTPTATATVGESQPTFTPGRQSPTPTEGIAQPTPTPTTIITQTTPTSTPTSTPTATSTPLPPTDTLTPTPSPTPSPAPTSEVEYSPGSRTITIHPGDAKAQTGRLCKGKLADVSRNAVFMRAAYLQEFGVPAGLLATVTHVYPENGINITLPDVEVGQYNDDEINADGEPLSYRYCAFNAVQAMREQIGLPSELEGFDDPPRWDHGTITIQLSSTPVGWAAKDKPVKPGIFAAPDQANMASQAITFRQFHLETAAINGTVYDPGSDDNTSYRIAYDRVGPEYWAGWEIVLPEIDVSDLSKLTFDIRGQSGGEFPNVWLASPPPPGETYDARNYVEVEDYVTVNTNWQRVEIPLGDFQPERDTDPTVDLTHIKGVQVVFEWEDMEGMVYVDGFAFE